MDNRSCCVHHIVKRGMVSSHSDLAFTIFGIGHSPESDRRGHGSSAITVVTERSSAAMLRSAENSYPASSIRRFRRLDLMMQYRLTRRYLGRHTPTSVPLQWSGKSQHAQLQPVVHDGSFRVSRTFLAPNRFIFRHSSRTRLSLVQNSAQVSRLPHALLLASSSIVTSLTHSCALLRQHFCSTCALPIFRS
jgi:hypothetical protein